MDDPRLRISFAFPPMDGSALTEVILSEEDAGGPPGEYHFRFTQVFDTGRPPDPESGDPHPGTDTYTFAGGASAAARAGRECEPTDTYTFHRTLHGKGEEYLVDTSAPRTNCDYTVDPIEVIRRDDGLEAIVFDLAQYLNQGALPPDVAPSTSRDLVAIMQLPGDGTHPVFESITFIFDRDDDGRPNEEPALPGLTLDDVRLVIGSLAAVGETDVRPTEG
jgi:hypothetical protein